MTSTTADPTRLDFNPSSGERGINPAIAEKYTGKSACVIGAGFGGMALAIRLQSAGIATTVVEGRDKPGGRAYFWEKDGFTFDASLDPDMTDQIRVTVVATGLGHAATNAESPMRIVRRPAAAAREEPNYHGLDKPTVQRKRAVGDGLEDAGLQEDLLDIPAFLRRQAD